MIFLEWDSISATASKCGVLNPEDGKYYRRTVETWNVTRPIILDGTQHNTGTITTTYERNDGGACVGRCEGSATSVATIYQFCTGDEEPSARTWSVSGTYEDDCSIDWSGTESHCGDTTAVDGHPFGLGSLGESEVTYEEEYTDEELLEEAEAALPDFDGDWNDAVGSFKDFSGSGNWLVSIRKARYRLLHPVPPSCYLKVWLKKVFEPIEGDVVEEEIDPYIWEGSGNPCLPDPAHGIDHENNLIASAPVNLELPEEEGEIRVEIVKWSYLANYEPEGEDDSGWPPSE